MPVLEESLFANHPRSSTTPRRSPAAARGRRQLEGRLERGPHVVFLHLAAAYRGVPRAVEVVDQAFAGYRAGDGLFVSARDRRENVVPGGG